MLNVAINCAFHPINARYQPSQSDVAVFEALITAPVAQYLHCLRWYNHIKSYGDAMKKYAYKCFYRLFSSYNLMLIFLLKLPWWEAQDWGCSWKQKGWEGWGWHWLVWIRWWGWCWSWKGQAGASCCLWSKEIQELVLTEFCAENKWKISY